MSPLWMALPIALPLAGGALLLALPDSARWQRSVSLSACSVHLAVAIALLLAADQGTATHLLVGNWPAPFGIVLTLDRLAALMLALTAFLGWLVSLHSTGGSDRRAPHFHALLQFQLMGLNGAFLTGDLFNLFVWFELLLIASYALLLHGANAEQLRAGLRYVVYNLLASALFLVALALIYAQAGTLNLADLARVIASLPAEQSGLLQIAATLLLLVFAVKAGLLPLGFWLPGSYSVAPAAVAALFAIMTKVGVYAILRVGTTLFADTAMAAQAARFLLPVGLITLAVATLGSLAARGLRSLIAWLVMAAAGLLIAALALGSGAAQAAALYYLIQTTLTAACLFMLADLIAARRGDRGDQLELRAPLIAPRGLTLMFALALVAAAGLPPLPGFLGKALILQASLAHPAAPWVWGIVLASSLGILIALTRAWSQLVWNRSAARDSAAEVTDPRAWLSPALLLAGLIALSAQAGPVQRYLQAAAEQLQRPQNQAVLDLAPQPRPEIHP